MVQPRECPHTPSALVTGELLFVVVFGIVIELLQIDVVDGLQGDGGWVGVALAVKGVIILFVQDAKLTDVDIKDDG